MPVHSLLGGYASVPLLLFAGFLKCGGNDLLLLSVLFELATLQVRARHAFLLLFSIALTSVASTRIPYVFWIVSLSTE